MRPRKPLPLAQLPAELREAVRRRYWSMMGVRYAPDTGIERADLTAAPWPKIEAANRYWSRAESMGEALPIGAPDDELVAFAERRAQECARVADHRLPAPELRALMANVARRYGLDAPAEEIADGPAIARMLDPLWWRRAVRRITARDYEGLAIGAGLVHARAGLYCSDAALRRRIGQNARNAETLERVEIENDAGHRFTLAELAKRSTANKRIRRGELMVRIAGFEECAKLAGHVAEFVTITCPSRFHSRTHGDGAANPGYSGATPREAQRYLCGVWSRIRAKLAREGVPVYGFRIAEPHHDGCPHWHLLLFVPADAPAKLRQVVARYALADSPTEPGAARYRVKFEAIDPARGSAAGYVAKYVAKNIDGAYVGDDLFGVPAVESSARVDAWAATWGIRQFQQVGGPPVGLWRELRRIPPGHVAAAQSEALQTAWEAAQRRDQTKADAQDNASAVRVRPARRGHVEADHPADFAGFVRAWGGPLAKRTAGAFRLLRVWHDAPGRYGEAVGFKPAGIEARYFGRDGLVKRWLWERVESVRHLWRVVRASIGERARRVQEAVAAIRAAVRIEPRTRVNNCTDAEAGDLWITSGQGGKRPPNRPGGGGFAVAAGPAPAGMAA